MYGMKMIIIATTIAILCVVSTQSYHTKDEGCKVFCGGPLLDAVQRSKIFQDSKTFVDMPLILDPDQTLSNFDRVSNKSDPSQLRTFVAEHFSAAGTELEPCNPQDFVDHPQTLDVIQDPIYRRWAREIHAKWRTLCRKVKQSVHKEPWKYSLIPLPYPFIAPGGRFREMYYWDSFWIIKGLLASDMPIFARNMIRNLGFLVNRYGFVPNGNRIYYTNRSQPPVLPMCVQAYYESTKDGAFVKEMLPLLEKEREFWEKERSVSWDLGDRGKFDFYQFRVSAQGPRPESYIEDIETAHLAHVDEESAGRRQLYADIAGAAESGWDFSSRWLSHHGDNRHTLQTMRTSQIIPIDLNSFKCGNSKILADLYHIVGNVSMSQHHSSEHMFHKYAVHQAFWDEKQGSWFDLDLESGEMSDEFYLSNPTPLYTDCTHDGAMSARRMVNYLSHTGALEFPGGLSTSFYITGQQWDAPNGWAPNNHMVIQGLRNQAPNDPVVQETAFRLADRWVQTHFFVYLATGGKMFEKYDVSSPDAHAGGGGEYEVQEGFGWTNGVILDLLLTYGDRLRVPNVHSYHARKMGARY